MNRICTKKKFIGSESTGVNQPLKWLPGLILLALFLAVLPASGRDRDDRYLKVFDLIAEGDSLSKSNKQSAALAKYQEAYSGLQSFQRDYPEWNPKTVSFRLKDLSEKITTISAGPSTQSSGSGASGSDKSGAAGSSAAAQVKLLEAGTDPKLPIRLHPKAGDKQVLTIDMKVTVETEAAGTQMPAMKLPAAKITLEVTASSVSPDGDIGYELVVSDVAVEEASGDQALVGAAMKSSLMSLKGLSGSGTISSRGVSKAAQIKVSSSADPKTQQAADQLKDSLSHLVTVFPQEPIGQGASWEVKMPVKTEGMTISQTTTYKLASAESDHLKIDTTVAQTAANQKIESPAMPGMKMDVTKMTGTGKGNAALDLSKLLATEGTMEMHIEMNMALNMGGQKQPMTVKTTQEIQVGSK